MYHTPLCLHNSFSIYRRILLVQFLLLREEVQALPQRDIPQRAPLWDGQREITEHIECVGVVGAH